MIHSIKEEGELCDNHFFKVSYGRWKIKGQVSGISQEAEKSHDKLK